MARPKGRTKKQMSLTLDIDLMYAVDNALRLRNLLEKKNISLSTFIEELLLLGFKNFEFDAGEQTLEEYFKEVNDFNLGEKYEKNTSN